MFKFILAVLLIYSEAQENVSTSDIEFFRILHRRDALENILKDDPKDRCRNGGIYAGGQCHCPHPHTGPTCQDFKCENEGISVGKRFDPDSFMFSKPCICKDGFKGDLCEYRLDNKCNDKGEWKNGKCECIGFFFGEECQFTSHCVFGAMKHGRCICNKGFEGDYCDRIVCYHGYADVKNHSRSCVCPAKYKGMHCDECAQVGPHIAAYPKCVVEFVGHAKTSRKKNNQQIKSRVVIIVAAVSFLALVALLMFSLHLWTKKRANPEEEAIRMRALAERESMLKEAVLKADLEQEQTTITKKERKRSITNPFRFNIRKFSITERTATSTRRKRSTPDGL